MMETIFQTLSPLGEPLAVYKNAWGVDTEEGEETLSVVTGLHGDRWTGLYVASRLAAFLQGVTDRTLPKFELTGRIQIFPVVNLRALEAAAPVWPLDNLDTDLAFPGTLEGDLTEKICHALLQHTAKSAYGLILQAGSPLFTEVPHIRLYSPDRPLRHLARSLGLGIARLLPNEPAADLQLMKQWSQLRVQALGISTGGAHRLDRETGDTLLEGIRNYLLMTGLLIHPNQKGKRQDTDFFGPRGECHLKCAQAGLFVPDLKLGASVRRGQVVGKIQDLYEGRTLEEIKVPKDGVLVSLRRHPLVNQGEPVACLLTEKYPRWYWPFG
ncbi:MAG: succinylglutamate desuccinylase/aspartoacylase family protein [Nitrospinaceae bacterium]